MTQRWPMGTLGLSRIVIEGFRNIREASVVLDGRSGIFWGANGSGKTSFLEAIYVLGRGKTFRGRRSGDLTTAGFVRSRVDLVLDDGFGSGERTLGFLRGAGGVLRFLDGKVVGDSAEWLRMLPVRFVGEGAAGLLSGEPALRRGFLDLNLFHVEQGAGVALRRFGRVLAQRNAWLKGGARGKATWDGEFVAAGLDLHRLRVALIDRLNSDFAHVVSRFPFLSGVEVHYQRGWAQGQDLDAALRADGIAERSASWTRVGPQRADFSVQIGGQRSAWSHGQAKTIACLLQLAFERRSLGSGAQGALWLVDDLWSDLDSDASAALAGLMLETGGQCLFTRVGEASRMDLPGIDPRVARFHVKHGTIVRMS